MRIHLVPNTDNPLACATACSLLAALTAEGHVVDMGAEDALGCGCEAAVAHASDADLVVALGGDGTILKAVHRLGGADVPVLGVNQGRLGFLCGGGDLDPLATVRAALEGRAREERRAMLRTTVTLGGRESGSHEALNEVFVGRAAGGRAVDLAIDVDGEPLARWVCDGVVIATPTGSTAYSLSAGGPLVDPQLRALVLVPVCAHTLSARPFVLGPEATVTVTLPDPARSDAGVQVDGDAVPCRTPLERVEVSLAQASVRLLRVDGRGFVAAVRDTFMAGS